jgi:hypothetical protein
MSCIPLNVNFGEMVEYKQLTDNSKTLTSASNIDTLVLRFLDQNQTLVDMTYIKWTCTLRFKTFMTMEEYQKYTASLNPTTTSSNPVYFPTPKETPASTSIMLNNATRKRGFFGNEFNNEY